MSTFTNDGQCKRGHQLTPQNVYLRSDGRRRCKTCNRDRKAAERTALKAGTKQSKPLDREQAVRRFGQFSQRVPTGCWTWSGPKTTDGYGHLSLGNTKWLAHRLSYVLRFGTIPTGLFVCHHCDNPECTNPDHLYAGSHLENMADRNRRGRARGGVLAGAAGTGTKLTEVAVAEIRAATGISQAALGRRYGVHRSTISDIRAGRSWGCLTTPDQPLTT